MSMNASTTRIWKVDLALTQADYLMNQTCFFLFKGALVAFGNVVYVDYVDGVYQVS